MLLQQITVPHVGLEPKGEGVSYSWNDADDLVDQNINRHARERDARNAAASGIDQGKGRDESRGGVTHSRDEADNRIEAEAKSGAGKAKKLVHDQSEPLEERLKAGASFLFFRWKNFPF